MSGGWGANGESTRSSSIEVLELQSSSDNELKYLLGSI